MAASSPRYPDGTNHRYYGYLDAVKILPAGDLGHAAIAWTQPVGSVNGLPAGLGWTGAMGPAGTVSLEWVHRNGQVIGEAAQNALAVTRSTDITSVRFQDAAGRQLGETTVTPSLDPDNPFLAQIRDAR